MRDDHAFTRADSERSFPFWFPIGVEFLKDLLPLLRCHRYEVLAKSVARSPLRVLDYPACYSGTRSCYSFDLHFPGVVFFLESRLIHLLNSSISASNLPSLISSQALEDHARLALQCTSIQGVVRAAQCYRVRSSAGHLIAQSPQPKQSKLSFAAWETSPRSAAWT